MLWKYFAILGKIKTEFDFLTLILEYKIVFILHCELEAMDHSVFGARGLQGSGNIASGLLPRFLAPLVPQCPDTGC